MAAVAGFAQADDACIADHPDHAAQVAERHRALLKRVHRAGYWCGAGRGGTEGKECSRGERGGGETDQAASDGGDAVHGGSLGAWPMRTARP
ncbi:hypothetical protein [Streptomyces sp. NPDC056817]|uniref:hypothetical protein n=1 Tax=Streptomyces sp. NPDC056817 TaxID=3345950 RepID=UPI0036B73B88